MEVTWDYVEMGICDMDHPSKVSSNKRVSMAPKIDINGTY